MLPNVIERKKKLRHLRKKIKASKTIRKKRYTLGKKGRSIGILIHNRKTRKKIRKEYRKLKRANMNDVKLYLKKHGLIKVGSNAPNHILRSIYETSVLSGDVYNKNSNILFHNYINDKT